ncbi:hypothetical protein Emag_006933 [Eimeria magna]
MVGFTTVRLHPFTAAAAARAAAAAAEAAAAAAGHCCVSVLAGTIMREVDCKALGRLLTPSSAKLKSKGISSVESRVGLGAKLAAKARPLPQRRVAHEVGVVVVDGTIKDCRVFSDALLVELIQAFQDTLTGKRSATKP